MGQSWFGTSLLTQPRTNPPRPIVNRDGVVDVLDLVLVAAHFGQTGQNRADVNGDGVVNLAGLGKLVVGALENAAASPPSRAGIFGTFTAEDMKKMAVADAKQLDQTNPSVQNGIIALERLLTALTQAPSLSNRDGSVAELPESVQSGDLDTVSVRCSGRGHC